MTDREKALEFLRAELLKLKPSGPTGFEGLLATCLSSLTGLVLRLAKSGSQFGRDASSPVSGFAIAMEAKRYSSSPPLEDVVGKSAVGGHALADAIDVWVLGCTSEVGDETLARLRSILEDRGITLLALDWTLQPLPPLAVLVAAAKPVVIAWFNENAAAVSASDLKAHVDCIAADTAFSGQVNGLKHELSAAHVGLDALRRRSAEWLKQRFADRAESRISFGQCLSVADVMNPALVRSHLDADLQRLIESGRDGSHVLAILGDEGVGKSWLVANWWELLPEPPIMLVVAGRRADQLSAAEPLESLARLLAEQEGRPGDAGIRSWHRRLARWQLSGANGEIRFVLVLDGVNEHSNLPWADIIASHRKVLEQLGGVVIATSRRAFWQRDVAPRLPRDCPVKALPVDVYSDTELNAVLARAGIPPADLSPAVRTFVRNPRVCALALTLAGRLRLEASAITIERLLLDYWRSRLEERGDLVAHNVQDFNKLLQLHARAWMEGQMRTFDRDDWIERSGVARRGSPEQALNDLPEIEEGRFLTTSSASSQEYEFRREALPFALGLLINAELTRSLRAATPGSVDADEVLERILDPVRGFDAMSDVVAAASGLACLDEEAPGAVREALIRAWCALQNVTEDSLETMLSYVPICVDAFLNVAEVPSKTPVHFGRRESIAGLLLETRDRPIVATALQTRLPGWLARWSRATLTIFGSDAERQAKHHAEREARTSVQYALLSQAERTMFMQMAHESGEATAIPLDRLAVYLLAARKLAPHVNGLWGWCLVQVLAHDVNAASEELAWIVRLNHVDAGETARAAREIVDALIVEASAPVRSAAAILLRLLGDRESARLAEKLSPYRPGETWRRVQMLCDTNPHDPSAAPGGNLDAARDVVATLNPMALWKHMSSTMEDHDLGDVAPALARFDSDSIAILMRQIAATAPARSGLALRQLAWRLPRLSPLFDGPTIDAIREAIELLLADPSRVATEDRFWIICECACSILPHLSGSEQLALFVKMPREMPLFTDMDRALQPVSADELSIAVATAKASGDEDLARVFFFAAGSGSALTPESRRVVRESLSSSCEILAITAAKVFCRAADHELDLAVLDDVARGERNVVSLEGSHWYEQALSAAIVRSGRKDLLKDVHPRFLTLVADTFGESALDRMADVTEHALMRALEPLVASPPQDIRPVIEASADGVTSVSRVEDRAKSEGTMQSQVLDDLRDLEGGARRFAERNRSMVESMLIFEKELAREGMAAIAQAPQVTALRAVVARDPTRCERWVARILTTDDARVLGQVRNLGLAIASAYASFDPERAATALVHLRDERSIVRVSIDGIELYSYSLFAAAEGPAICGLREKVFHDAFSDHDLASATLAAETCGAVEWLTGFVTGLIASDNVGDQARGLTIAGFRLPSSPTDDLLSGDWGTGFLGEVAAFARKNAMRARWAEHWIRNAQVASDGCDLWRYALLAEGVVDGRFASVARCADSAEPWSRFAAGVVVRLRDAATGRSKKREKTLFGRNVPESGLVQMLRDSAAANL